MFCSRGSPGNFQLHTLGITKKKAASGIDVRAALAVVINRNLDSVKKCQGDFFMFQER